MMKRPRSHHKAKRMSSKAGDSSSDDSILTLRMDILSKGGLSRWPHSTGSSTLHRNEPQDTVKKGY